MHIKDVEQRTGLSRANIRYYEQEGLVHPARRKNGYRDYSPHRGDPGHAGREAVPVRGSVPAAGGPAPPGGAGPDGSVRVPGHAGRPRLL